MKTWMKLEVHGKQLEFFFMEFCLPGNLNNCREKKKLEKNGGKSRMS